MHLRHFVGKKHADCKSPTPPETKPGKGEFDKVAPYYDHLMRGVPYRDWVDYLQALLKRLGAEPRAVLDLCCGTGRVGSDMRQRGYNAVGVDLSEPMVRGCREQHPPLPAAVMDASFLALKPGLFDLVVSLYDSLNYILEPSLLAKCFADVFETLRPDGLFIFDVNTPRALSTGLFSQDNLRSDDALLYSWKAHWDAKARICRVDMWFKWRTEGRTEEFEETHRQYAYRHREVTAMLAEAGFELIDAYQAYTFRPVTRRSDRAYYIARREH